METPGTPRSQIVIPSPKSPSPCLQRIFASPVRYADIDPSTVRDPGSFFGKLLVSCVLENNPQSLLHYLRKGADPNFVNEDGFTPLITAVKYNMFECAQLLLEGGAHVSLRTKSNDSPLEVALQSKNMLMYDLLEEWISQRYERPALQANGDLGKKRKLAETDFEELIQDDDGPEPISGDGKSDEEKEHDESDAFELDDVAGYSIEKLKEICEKESIQIDEEEEAGKSSRGDTRRKYIDAITSQWKKRTGQAIPLWHTMLDHLGWWNRSDSEGEDEEGEEEEEEKTGEPEKKRRKLTEGRGVALWSKVRQNAKKLASALQEGSEHEISHERLTQFVNAIRDHEKRTGKAWWLISDRELRSLQDMWPWFREQKGKQRTSRVSRFGLGAPQLSDPSMKGRKEKRT